jgi:hypothetical protein
VLKKNKPGWFQYAPTADPKHLGQPYYLNIREYMIHYMNGTEIPHSNTGCGIRSIQGEEAFDFVYWREKDKVDCPECLVKIARLKLLKRPELFPRKAAPKKLGIGSVTTLPVRGID